MPLRGVIEVRQTFRALPGREGEVRDLLELAAEPLQRIGVKDRRVVEASGLFTETWRFASRDEWEGEDQVDDLLHRDRRLAALHVLLDEISDPDVGDFQVVEDGVPIEAPRYRLTEDDATAKPAPAFEPEEIHDGDLPTRAEVRALSPLKDEDDE